VYARWAGVTEVTVQGNHIRFAPVDLRESQQLRLKRLYPGTLVKPAVRTILVPRPATARIGGRPLRDKEILDWARGLLDAVVLDDVSAAAAAAGARS
jgi:transcription-repair coupling factor (superfamily II helicase)